MAVQEDEYISRTKKTDVFYGINQRIEMVQAFSAVDRVITYTEVDKTIRMLDYDVFAVGEDQVHDGFKNAIEFSIVNGRKVVRLHRTDGVSSSYIKECISELK